MPEPTLPEVSAPNSKYLLLWFTPDGELKLKAEGLDLYGIVGVLRAATLKFDKTLTLSAPSASASEKKSTGA